MTITPDQCRAARTLLYWTQPDLAEAVGMTREAIANFERGVSTPHVRNMAAIQAALEAAGILFVEGSDTVGPGLHIRDPQKK